jgi:hypothetical protein
MPGATNLTVTSRGTDEERNRNRIRRSILRKMMDVKQSWRHCHRKSCKRGRGCCGRDVQCAGEQKLPVPRNSEKAARDQARSMAMLQRMLRERLEQLQRERQQAAVQPPSQPARARRRQTD